MQQPLRQIMTQRSAIAIGANHSPVGVYPRYPWHLPANHVFFLHIL